MIARWKLHRELNRLREHFWALGGLAYEPVLKRRHDRWRRALPVPPDGGIARGAKVAILLAFQPSGLAPSTFLTLRHFVDKGYAPLVVSNAPLAPADRAALHPLTWRVVERPNFGYDFGGYRDGILLLRDWGVVPDRLLVMNDSVWLPLRTGSTLLDRMEAAQGDVIGGFLHPDRMRQRPIRTLREGFVESYLYVINRPALVSPAFRDYWSRYRLSSNKYNAVRLGERRFSVAMRAGGLSVTGLFTPAGFLDALRAADDASLRRTLFYGAYIDTDLAAERDALSAEAPEDGPAPPGWRDRVLAHAGRTADRRRFNASFPYPSDALLGMDFLKKSLGPRGSGMGSLHRQMRHQMLAAVAAGDLPPLLPEVAKEVQALEAEAP